MRLLENSNHKLEVDSKSPKRLSGVFAVLDEWNQNNRRYPSSVYLEALKEIIPKIKERRLLAELDHPIDYDEVRLSNVSHVIVGCNIKESNSGKKVVYGTVELLDTPAGKIAQALVKAGIPLGISSRAVGNTKRVSEGVDVTQMKLITYDLVAEPSFTSAILSETKKSELSESLNFIESKLPMNESSKENDSIRTSINRIRESLSLPETTSGTRVHINEKLNTQTLEIETLKKLVESKKSVILSDTESLKESRKMIKELKTNNKELDERYQSLQENHQKLQDSYNMIKRNKKLEEERKITEMSNEIVELRKRLAVERRGMSYAQVSSLLEGVTSEKDIETKLDTLSNLGKRSNKVKKEVLEDLNESLINTPTRSKLSTIISRI